jgi:PEP-CTERM motif
MKKLILTLSAAASLLAYQAFGQTISISGTNINATPGSTVADQLTLQIIGANSIGNVESVNILMGTPSTGVHSGVSFFTTSIGSFNSPFNTANNPGTATFNKTGDANNSGFTLTSMDVGDNAPAASAAPVASSGTTTIPFETLNFTLASNTPVGTYTFMVGAGGTADAAQGSFIDNSSNTQFSVNSEPTFTITVVPEPATLSLLGLSGLGSLGLNILRRRRTLS